MNDASPVNVPSRVLVVRFAGDSGDGVQLAGLRFASATAVHGADLMTLPEYPAEIRAPTGTTFGVSAYQVQFGSGEVLTPGDEADLLIALNPAAYVTNIGFLKPGGTVVIDEGAFNQKAFAKAGLDADPLDAEAESRYRILRVDISKRTLEAVADCGLGRKDSLRAKNFWSLGLALWLCGEGTDESIAWLNRRFAKDPALEAVNRNALLAGHAYGETTELTLAEAGPPAAATGSASAPMISGTEAMALGIAAAGALSGRTVHYCSYPITPASALLHAVARMKEGLKTFQAEDEIAAICAAIGASYAGAIDVTASSGPGLSLKTEGLGLAVMAELPLLVIDVQRAGPSTGMPTKPEQADLAMAIFGRHGEAPLPVFAPATPADCFDIMIDAARAALSVMTPVLVLSDAYLANAVSEWSPPDIGSLPDIEAGLPPGAAAAAHERDPATLAQPWIVPGTPGKAFRVGGLEKDAATGNISYDPANHDAMVKLRAEKVARLARPNDGAMLREGPDSGALLAISWGSTFGSVRQATRNLRARGADAAHLHLRRLWPLPPELAQILPRYRRIVCAELNSGQLSTLLRATYLLPVEAHCQVNGRPFLVSGLEAALCGNLIGVAG